MSERDDSRGSVPTLRGFAVPEPSPKRKATPDPATAPTEPVSPVPNPATMGRPGPETAPMRAAPGPRATAPLAAPNPPTAAPAVPMGGPGSGAIGDGPIRVVCRRCQRTVWGWKYPFGVSCPLGDHHAHINWFLVGVVASFWTAFIVLMISLVAIAAG